METEEDDMFAETEAEALPPSAGQASSFTSYLTLVSPPWTSKRKEGPDNPGLPSPDPKRRRSQGEGESSAPNSHVGQYIRTARCFYSLIVATSCVFFVKVGVKCAYTPLQI
jgi:hypothetical protein